MTRKYKKIGHDANMSKTGKTFSPEFDAQAVLLLLREGNTVNELAVTHQISPVVIGGWKTQFLERASEVFKNVGGHPIYCESFLRFFNITIQFCYSLFVGI